MNKLQKHRDIRKQKSQKNTWENIQINLFTVTTSEEESLSPHNLYIHIYLYISVRLFYDMSTCAYYLYN